MHATSAEGSNRSCRKEAILQEHCRTVGRDHREIERTTVVGTVVIRDSRAEAQRVFEKLFAENGRARLWTDQPVGTPDDVAAAIRPYRRDRAGLPSPARRLPRALRRGVDDPLRHGGPPPTGAHPDALTLLPSHGGTWWRPGQRDESPASPQRRLVPAPARGPPYQTYAAPRIAFR